MNISHKEKEKSCGLQVINTRDNSMKESQMAKEKKYLLKTKVSLKVRSSMDMHKVKVSLQSLVKMVLSMKEDSLQTNKMAKELRPGTMVHIIKAISLRERRGQQVL